MENKVGKLLSNQMSTTKFKDPYADEILTEEEIQSALRKARHDKAIARKSREYAELISKPKEYPKLTVEEFKYGVLSKIKTKIPDYIIDERNEKNFNLLSLYFMRDPEFEKVDGGKYSFSKGIALQGPIGCGKTSMIMGFNVNPTNCFGGISCRKVAADYSLKDVGGSLTIEKYSGLHEAPPYDNFGQRYIGRMFDDLGTENVKKHFGNESNVMEEILLNRYDNPDLVGKTHITTNLSAEQIEEIYGPRVRSRLRQMCNFIVFNPKGGDRRR